MNINIDYSNFTGVVVVPSNVADIKLYREDFDKLKKCFIKLNNDHCQNREILNSCLKDTYELISTSGKLQCNFHIHYNAISFIKIYKMFICFYYV